MAVFKFPIVKILKVQDGDTCACLCDLRFKDGERQLAPDVGVGVYDLGFGIFGSKIAPSKKGYTKRVVRVNLIDSPEIHSTDPLQAKAGAVAQAFAAIWLGRAMMAGGAILISRGLDDYGRCLGDVYVEAFKANEPALYSDAILAEGLARPYHGLKKDPWPEADLLRISNWKAAAP